MPASSSFAASQKMAQGGDWEDISPNRIVRQSESAAAMLSVPADRMRIAPKVLVLVLA